MTHTRYTFGDSNIATERLKRIAVFFNPLAEEFITSHLNRKIELAIDLGCGPGFSTAMIAKTTKAPNVIGIDISENFLDYAKKHFPNFTFIKDNVKAFHLKTKADLIYLRFLLSHLDKVRSLVKSWLNHLNPNGMLIIDELEDIYTDNTVFLKYLSVNEELIYQQGAKLYIGKTLDQELSGLPILFNESRLIPVPDWQAASWFYPNTMSVWEKEEWTKLKLTKIQRTKISEQLFNIFSEKKNISNITWRMKKMIIGV